MVSEELIALGTNDQSLLFYDISKVLTYFRIKDQSFEETLNLEFDIQNHH